MNGGDSNVCELLVGMQIGRNTIENIMEVIQNIKNRTTHDPAILLNIFPRKSKILICSTNGSNLSVSR